jgi:hypothetical protein
MKTVETNAKRKVTIQHFVDEVFLYNMGCRESITGVNCDPVAKFIQLMKDNGITKSEEFISIIRKLRDINGDSHSRVETLKELFNFIDGEYKRLANEYIESSGKTNWPYPRDFVANLFQIGLEKLIQLKSEKPDSTL